MTLLEAIVAFVVLALVGIACLDLSRGATALQRSSAEWTEAVKVGESALAAAAANAPANASANAPARSPANGLASGSMSRTSLTGMPQVTRRLWRGDVDVVEVTVPLSNGRVFQMQRLVSRRSPSNRLAAASAR